MSKWLNLFCQTTRTSWVKSLGGRLMHWMDIAAAMAATRHSNHVCVTAAVDELSFLPVSRRSAGSQRRPGASCRALHLQPRRPLSCRGRSHIDNHTTIDHRVPHSTSREIYKGVAPERSRAVFNGRIVGSAGRPANRRAPDQPQHLFSATAPWFTPNRIWRSSPTTSSARTAPPSAA